MAVGLAVACGSDAELPAKGASRTLVFHGLDGSPQAVDVLTAVDAVPLLIELEDPNYQTKKKFRGLPLATVLSKGFGVSPDELRGKRIVFTAADGYAVHADAAVALETGGFLAVEDVEVPGWEPIGPHRVTPAPFYVVWTQTHQRDQKRYPWPYGLARVELIDLATTYGRTFPRHVPTDAVAKRGHDLFLRDCIRCHAVNRQGGRLGPEMNVPRNVLEYRDRETLRAFILRPASFRYGNMPAMPHLSDADLDAILRYLEVMAIAKFDNPGR